LAGNEGSTARLPPRRCLNAPRAAATTALTRVVGASAIGGQPLPKGCWWQRANGSTERGTPTCLPHMREKRSLLGDRPTSLQCDNLACPMDLRGLSARGTSGSAAKVPAAPSGGRQASHVAPVGRWSRPACSLKQACWREPPGGMPGPRGGSSKMRAGEGTWHASAARSAPTCGNAVRDAIPVRSIQAYRRGSSTVRPRSGVPPTQ